MLSFTQEEERLFKSLKTPAKIQDFLNEIPMNFKDDGPGVLKSPLMVMREWNAHCFEGALLGAYILSLHGHSPLIMHLEATPDDDDHVVALFKKRGLWGALSKTNHAVLRYREPVYRTTRELAISFFHEYFKDDGGKRLRRYSKPLNLNTFESNWMLLPDDLWGIDEVMNKSKHFDLAPKDTWGELRPAEKIERVAGKLVEWEIVQK